ncbi:MAG: T9SS type A sorting domain-containing protein, partial [Bacteroidia bacterium]
DDQVFDTPTSQGPNYGCVAYPHISCGNAPDGDLFSDYMDYSDDECMNIFTWGQKTRMDATLGGFRSNLISSANLIATGTNGVPAVPCMMVSDFYADKYFVCTGSNVNFNDASWNGDATSWSWSFQGGTPSTSGLQNPVIQYNSPGLYYATLSVTNAAGTVSLTKTNFIKVYPAVSNYTAPFTENFESVIFPSTDWEVENTAGGSTWAISADASVSGVKSVKLDNFSGNISGSTDIFITPAYDFSNIGNAIMTFKLASAGTDTSGTDNLRVYVTSNCGLTWSLRYIKTGNAFYTAGIVTGNFIPIASQWRTETLLLSSPQFSGQPNVKFKFIYTHDSSNNIFIDDININGIPLGIENYSIDNFNVEVYPNPASNYCELRISDVRLNGELELSMFDITGREVYKQNPQSSKVSPQTYVIPSPGIAGVYLLKIKVNGTETRKKIIFLEN